MPNYLKKSDYFAISNVICQLGPNELSICGNDENLSLEFNHSLAATLDKITGEFKYEQKRPIIRLYLPDKKECSSEDARKRISALLTHEATHFTTYRDFTHDDRIEARALANMFKREENGPNYLKYCTCKVELPAFSSMFSYLIVQEKGCGLDEESYFSAIKSTSIYDHIKMRTETINNLDDAMVPISNNAWEQYRLLCP